ncbi:hypothetical protein CDD83_717 [Cordyceps sp. RAO-2017]|nr:hypothetical protein CDD83_717 [Cordyceps sp. RAO-2017]
MTQPAEACNTVSLHPHGEELATRKGCVVGPSAAADLVDFGFCQGLSLFQTPQADQLSVIAGSADGFLDSVSGYCTESWGPPLVSTAEAYPQLVPTAFPPVEGSPFQCATPAAVSKGRACAADRSSADTAGRRRLKARARQISLPRKLGPPRPAQEASRTREVPWMAHLADINTRLLGLVALLPQPAELRCKGWSSESGRTFPIDEMFTLTRQVIESLEGGPGDGPDRRLRLDGSDPGNSMFVLSTYVRLLDVFQRVFHLVGLELAHRGPQAKFPCR